MFIKLTDKHKKRILWAMLIVIVPAFVLWGSSAMRGSAENIVGRIEGEPIKRDDFRPYIEIAQLYWLINAEGDQSIGTNDILALAGDFYLLIYQAKKEGIQVSDEKVIESIQNMPSFLTDAKFNPQKYQQFISYIQRKMGSNFLARNFEEYIRNILKREKLFNRHIDVKISDEEVLAAYKIKNQKAKISYLLIPYESFMIDTNIPLSTLEDFYKQNKDLFERPPKIKVKYISLEPDREKTETVIRRLNQVDNLENLGDIPIVETDFFSKGEPIKGIGFVPQINQTLFSLATGKLSPAFSLKDKVLIFQKSEEKESFTPAFSKIKDEVKRTYLEDRAKKQTKEIAEEIIAKVKTTGSKDLAQYAAQKEIEFSQTGFFQYNDYIQGFGLSNQVSQLVFFELEEDEIYTKPLARNNGVYILKLEEKTDIDPEKFDQEKRNYYQTLKTNREITKKIKYLTDLSKKLTFSLKDFR